MICFIFIYADLPSEATWPWLFLSWSSDFFIFQIFRLASHSLNLEEILDEFFSRDGDGRDVIELENFIAEIHTAQEDFQVVLGRDDDLEEPFTKSSATDKMLFAWRHKKL